MNHEKFKAIAKKRLNDLDTYQKAIIYGLYSENNHTAELPLHDGAVNFLEYSMMIGKATTQYMVLDLNNACFPYMLQPWVISKLQKDTELLSSFKQSFNKFQAKIKVEMDEELRSSYNPYSYRQF
ncbi:hypothetical protein C1149_04945 [Clostridium botulinum]|nr:hypothetical protein C1149_04945 [Clostridium botulinum]